MKLLSHERTAKTEARVRLPNLVNNYRAAARCTDRPVMCVVKADAYGHGAVRCVRALAAEGVRNFAVSSLSAFCRCRGTEPLPVPVGNGWKVAMK